MTTRSSPRISRRITSAAAFFLLTASCLQHARANTEWPTLPSLLELDTDYGHLNVKNSEYIYDSQLLWDGLELDPNLRGLLNITYAFKLPQSVAVLVSINDGSSVCPIHFRWVILKKEDATISPEFGSCSDRIKVSATLRTLTLRTPNPTKPDKIDVYVYDGKKITHMK
jgi:hypothetical protein